MEKLTKQVFKPGQDQSMNASAMSGGMNMSQSYQQ